MDNYKIRLYGFTWIRPTGEDRRLLEHALLWEEPIEDKSGCAKLLLAFFLCLSMLSDENVRQQKATDHFCPGVSEVVTRVHPNVFRSDNSRTMYKLFDYGRYREGPRAPNLQIARDLYKENAELVLDSSSFGVSKREWRACSYTTSTI